MSLHIFDMVLSGLIYVILVYFIMKMLKTGKKKTDGDDENEGGISVHLLPDLDLPPGVSLPGDSPSTKEVEEPEEAMV